MKITHVIGVDPGIVHTGAVRMVFKPVPRKIVVEEFVQTGCKPGLVKQWADGFDTNPDAVFVEDYRPRGNVYGTDKAMQQAIAGFRGEWRTAKLLDNTGVKKVVTKDLMDLLGVWKFTARTHHQDLRSAARIALFGMLKDEQHNALLSTVVRDHLLGETWTVIY